MTTKGNFFGHCLTQVSTLKNNENRLLSANELLLGPFLLVKTVKRQKFARDDQSFVSVNIQSTNL